MLVPSHTRPQILMRIPYNRRPSKPLAKLPRRQKRLDGLRKVPNGTVALCHRPAPEVIVPDLLQRRPRVVLGRVENLEDLGVLLDVGLLADVDVELLVRPRADRVERQRLAAGIVVLLRKVPRFPVLCRVVGHLQDAGENVRRGDELLAHGRQEPHLIAVRLHRSLVSAAGWALDAVAQRMEPEPASEAELVVVGAPGVVTVGVSVWNVHVAGPGRREATLVMRPAAAVGNVHGVDLLHVAVRERWLCLW